MKQGLASISDWVEDLIRDRKLRWMVAIPSAIGTILIIVGIATQLRDLANVSLLCTTVFLGVVVIVMALSRRHMRREIGNKQAVLDHYGDWILRSQRDNPDYFAISAWNEEQTVAKRGDTVIVRDIDITAGAIPVPAVWTRASANSTVHLSPNVRSAIDVEARFLDDDGEPTTRIVTGAVWDDEKTIRILIYFSVDLAPNATTRIRLRIRWPRYAAELLDGRVEKEHWVFRRPVGSFSVKTVFTKDFAPLGVTVSKLANSPKPITTTNKTDGSTSLEFSVPNVEKDVEYGYLYEVNRRS